MQKGGAGLRHQPLSTFWDRWARLYDLTQWTNRRANAAAAARTAALTRLSPPTCSTCSRRRVRRSGRVTAPGGRLLLPTYLQGKVGTAYGAVIKIYHGVGFHYEHAFTPETYRAFLERLGLGHVTVEVIPGRLPVGLAVLQKPKPSGGPF